MSSVSELTERLEKMQQEVSQLRELVLKTQKQRDQYHRLYLQMMECNRKLEVGLMGKKAERLPRDSSQLSFQVLEQMLGDKAVREVEELEVTEVRSHERHKSTGRKPFPEHFPRVDIEIIPEEKQRQGLDNFKRIGEEVTEVIERRPASVVIARVISNRSGLDLSRKSGAFRHVLESDKAQ